MVVVSTRRCNVHCDGCSDFDPLFGNTINATAMEESSGTGIPTISPVASNLQQRRLDDVAVNVTEDLEVHKCGILDLQCILGDYLSTVFCEEIVLSSGQSCKGAVLLITVDEKTKETYTLEPQPGSKTAT